MGELNSGLLTLWTNFVL